MDWESIFAISIVSRGLTGRVRENKGDNPPIHVKLSTIQ